MQSHLHVVPAACGGDSSALLSRWTCERADLVAPSWARSPCRGQGCEVQVGPDGRSSCPRLGREGAGPRVLVGNAVTGRCSVSETWPASSIPSGRLPLLASRSEKGGRTEPHRTWCVNATYIRSHQLCAQDLELNRNNTSSPVRMVSVSVWTGRPVESPFTRAGRWGLPVVPSGSRCSRSPAGRW